MFSLLQGRFSAFPHLIDHDFTSTTFDDEPFLEHEPLAQLPNFACPACQSRRTVPRDTGKKAGAAIGTVAGAGGGISGALSERKVKSKESLDYFLQVPCGPSVGEGGAVERNAALKGITYERAFTKVQALYEGHGRGAELSAARGTAWACSVR